MERGTYPQTLLVVLEESRTLIVVAGAYASKVFCIYLAECFGSGGGGGPGLTFAVPLQEACVVASGLESACY